MSMGSDDTTGCVSKNAVSVVIGRLIDSFPSVIRYQRVRHGPIRSHPRDRDFGVLRLRYFALDLILPFSLPFLSSNLSLSNRDRLTRIRIDRSKLPLPRLSRNLALVSWKSLPPPPDGAGLRAQRRRRGPGCVP